MFLDKKTLFKIWLNPGLNLTIFRGSGPPDRSLGSVVQLLANFFLVPINSPRILCKSFTKPSFLLFSKVTNVFSPKTDAELSIVVFGFFFRFKAKAIHISGLIKDRERTPLQETGDWIEYVLRHGGARHLRAQVFNIPWYQYYLLDVVAFLVAMITLAVMVIRLTCSCICRLCCKKDKDKAKKE